MAFHAQSAATRHRPLKKKFEVFCKNRNIKLILAPAGENRGTGMAERLIQTLKRRLAVLDIDPLWNSETLSSRIANVIENICLIPNKTTKVTPFEAHFGRKSNTELTNMLIKPSIRNLSYKILKSKTKKKCGEEMAVQKMYWTCSINKILNKASLPPSSTPTLRKSPTSN